MPKEIFTAKMRDFLLANYKGLPTAELTRRFNEQFGTDFSGEQIKSYKSRNKLKSGAPKGTAKGESRVFPDEIREFIYANYKGTGSKEMTRRLNDTFGTAYRVGQIKGFYGNHNLDSGVTGYFEKGHTPHNKGERGVCYAGAEKGWFQKGNIPVNHRGIGEERIGTDGYIQVKIAEPNIWKAKHRVLWEEKNGPIPKGYMVRFRDGNKRNVTIENLMLMKLSVNATINRSGLAGCTDERLDTAVMLAEAKSALSAVKKKRRRKKKDDSEKEQGKI